MKVNNAYCYINIELNRWPGDGKEEKKGSFSLEASSQEVIMTGWIKRSAAEEEFHI